MGPSDKEVAAVAAKVKDLDPRDRTRVVVRSLLTITVLWVVLFGVYFYERFIDLSHTGPVLELVIGVILIVVVLVFQYRKITSARYPMVRAIEAVCTIIPFFLVIFSMIYLSMPIAAADNFSVHLDHIKALYFTVTTFSTVGFGDITPTTDIARLVVSVQMLLDLVLIGVGLRLMLNAARTGLARDQAESSSAS